MGDQGIKHIGLEMGWSNGTSFHRRESVESMDSDDDTDSSRDCEILQETLKSIHPVLIDLTKINDYPEIQSCVRPSESRGASLRLKDAIELIETFEIIKQEQEEDSDSDLDQTISIDDLDDEEIMITSFNLLRSSRIQSFVKKIPRNIADCSLTDIIPKRVPLIVAEDDHSRLLTLKADIKFLDLARKVEKYNQIENLKYVCEREKNTIFPLEIWNSKSTKLSGVKCLHLLGRRSDDAFAAFPVQNARSLRDDV